MARNPTPRKLSTTPPRKSAPETRYFHYCNVRPSIPRTFASGVNADRASAINVLSDKWVNGTELSYYFSSVPTFFRGERVVEARNQHLNLLGVV